MSDQDRNSVEYTRRLYDDVLGWYRSADAKAQVVIGINGAFVAFLISTIFAKPADLKLITPAFSDWTWVLLGLMTISLLLSIIAALYCLWSRTYSTAELRDIVTMGQSAGSDTYEPKVMWFFQMISALGHDEFHRTLKKVDGDFEIKAMAVQIHILSGNVRKKHKAANIGFSFSGLTLILFLLAGTSYLLHNVA